MMLPVLAALASSGLSLLTNAILAKGKTAIEAKLGIKIPDTVAGLTPEVSARLREVQNSHEQFLVGAALEDKKIEAASQEAASKGVSERWVADMASDNQLSKNVRPIIVLFLTAVFCILALFDRDIKPSYIELFGDLLKLVYAAYFLGRSAEKGVDMIMKGKK